jgi:hypothetical protein
MSYGGEGADIDFETARGRDWPSIRQFNVFVENRLGGLLSVVSRFEMTDIRIVSLMIIDSTDCAIIRMVLSSPERAVEVFQQAKLPFTESDLLVVQLPTGDQPLIDICKSLLVAEINVHYAYPMLVGPAAALALYVEDHEAAARTLQSRGFTLYSEDDFGTGLDG